ncbi:hypothetical protein CARUB_v10010444mg [Capsella rubella]|uniref:Transmembrane protein n=1 Tax=Capsella rubella TaxID=81985 RepID=R0I8D5_9BRAS|nr:uncharacterized protein LOC17897521 isoform X2 [Capsella rubella]EOA38604.1 hypothetical protein CARUB_v10010444mg [Capsella rubella]
MASNLIFVVFFIFVSFSLTSGYSISTRSAVSKQEDESYVMDQESPMVVVEDVVRSRLLARVARSGAVVNKGSASKKSPSKGPKKKETIAKKINKINKIKKIKKIGALTVGAFVGIIIAAIVVGIAIICVVYILLVLYFRRKAKKAQSTDEQDTAAAKEKINDSSETQTSRKEDVV